MRKLMVVLMLVVLTATAAFAGEPLAYGQKDFMQMGLVFQHAMLDTTSGTLRGNEYGTAYSYIMPESGYAFHLTVSHVNLKGSYDDFDNFIDGGSPSVTLEVSKSFDTFGNNWQIGSYAKYKRYFGSVKGGEGGLDEYYDEFGDLMFSESWSDQSKVSNLQIAEAGLLVQKQVKKAVLYAGPMVQIIKGDLTYSYQSDSDSWSETTKVMANSGFGMVAGMVLPLGNDLTLGLTGTIKEHGVKEGGVGLNYTFDTW